MSLRDTAQAHTVDSIRRPRSQAFLRRLDRIATLDGYIGLK